MQEQYTTKRALRAIVAGLAVAAIAVGCVPDEGAERQPRQVVIGRADTHQQNGGSQGRDRADKPEPQPEAEPVEEEAPLETVAEANARTSAEHYLQYQSFSRTGLIDQLKFEGYGENVAIYGVDAAGADWNEQAVLSAESYLESQSFSRAGLVDQLIYEGFSRAQAEHGVTIAYGQGGGDKPEPGLETASEANARTSAESYLESQSFSRTGLIDQLKYEGFSVRAATYGADAAGADWNEQAVLSAKSYLKSQSFRRAGLVDQLIYEGFTQTQAQHGVSIAYR